MFNSNQSGGVVLFIRAGHSNKVVKGVSFEQCDVDDLLVNIKLENNKFVIVGNVYKYPCSALATFKEYFRHVLDLSNEKIYKLVVVLIQGCHWFLRNFLQVFKSTRF